jgi:hypothetical protein
MRLNEAIQGRCLRCLMICPLLVVLVEDYPIALILRVPRFVVVWLAASNLRLHARGRSEIDEIGVCIPPALETRRLSAQTKVILVSP